MGTRVTGANRAGRRPETARVSGTVALASMVALTLFASPAFAADTRAAHADAPRTAPNGLAFYRPPSPLPAGNPGDVLWSKPFRAVAGALAWKVLYHSRSVDG